MSNAMEVVRRNFTSIFWCFTVLLIAGQVCYLLWQKQPPTLVIQPDPVLLRTQTIDPLPVVVAVQTPGAAQRQYFFADAETGKITKPILSSKATSTLPLGKININRSGLSELEKLPGVGPKIAQRIIEYRTQHGPFPDIKSLMNVPGIGPKTYMKLEKYCTI